MPAKLWAAAWSSLASRGWTQARPREREAILAFGPIMDRKKAFVRRYGYKKRLRSSGNCIFYVDLLLMDVVKVRTMRGMSVYVLAMITWNILRQGNGNLTQ